jgi:hypothetical protein
MNGKKLITIVSILIFCALPGASIFSQLYDLNDAVGELGDVATTVSNLIGPNLGGMSSLGDPIGYAIIPHFEVGVAGGLVLVKADDIAAGTELDIGFDGKSYFPLPSIAAHGKFTVNRLEFGGKLGGIPAIDAKEAGISVQNLVIGGKVRYRLLNFNSFALKGGLSVGGFYEYMNGELTFIGSQTIPVDVDDDGTAEGEIRNDAGLESVWSSHTFGGEAQANFQVLFLNLFAGARLSKSFGKAETSIAGTSELVATGGTPGLIDDTLPPQIISISEEGKPEGIETVLYGGAEFKLLFMTITAKGGYNLKNEAIHAEAGARIQF